MPSRIRLIALAAATALAGCTDRTSSDPLTEAPTGVEPVARAEPATPDAARERLARRLAMALAEPKFRARLKQDLERSPFREQKLHFQRYLASADRHALRELARSAREPEG